MGGPGSGMRPGWWTVKGRKFNCDKCKAPPGRPCKSPRSGGPTRTHAVRLRKLAEAEAREARRR